MTNENSSPPLSTGAIIARMVAIRDERRQLSNRDKELIDDWRSLELELLMRMDEQGMQKAATVNGTASITETTLPQVVSWDEFEDHIYETKSLHLLQRRPAAAAFRELNDAGQCPPGVEPYVKREISLRKK